MLTTNLIQKWFSYRAFYVTITTAYIWSLKSLNTLFDKYFTTCWWNVKKIVWSKPYKILSFLTKMVNHFWQRVNAILEDVSVNEIIVWCLNMNLKTIIFPCSKDNGIATRVTRLKIAPNIADQSVLTKTADSLKHGLHFQQKGRAWETPSLVLTASERHCVPLLVTRLGVLRIGLGRDVPLIIWK